MTNSPCQRGLALLKLKGHPVGISEVSRPPRVRDGPGLRKHRKRFPTPRNYIVSQQINVEVVIHYRRRLRNRGIRSGKAKPWTQCLVCHFPQTVKVIHADKHEAIAQLVAASEQFDFVFHDNGHSGDDYVRDFSELLQLMPSGAVFVLDDIRWYGHGQQQSQRTCYEGWLEIIRHHRVAAALEIEGSMGLILLR